MTLGCSFKFDGHGEKHEVPHTKTQREMLEISAQTFSRRMPDAPKKHQ